MNKGFITIIGAAALVASTAGFAGTPSADDSTPLGSHAGFYLNPNIGYGFADANVNKGALKALGISVSRNSFAWSSNLGYQFNPYFAFEVGYMQLPYVELKGLGQTDRIFVDASTFVAKGIYPVSQHFNVFAKAGIAYERKLESISFGDVTTTIDYDQSRVVPLFGVGTDYYITRNWAVDAQFISTLGSGDNFPATFTGMVGVTYKFS